MLFVVALAIFLFVVLIYLGTRETPKADVYRHVAQHVTANNERFDAVRDRYHDPKVNMAHFKASEPRWDSPHRHDRDPDIRARDKSFRDGGLVHFHNARIGREPGDPRRYQAPPDAR